MIDAGVREGALAVLTVPQGCEWISFKSRFLERDPKRRFFVLDYQETHGRKPPHLALGQYVGVSFRNKSRKIMFATVVEAKGRFMADGNQTIAAVRYRWPDSLTELQRRAYFRTPVPVGSALLVSMWPGGVGARESAQGRVLEIITGQARDLSCGGSLVQATTTTPPAWRDDQTLGVELQLPDGRPPVLLDAHFRGARHETDGTLCIAIQFVGLELTLEGRALLQRLARCVQKFHRLSLARELRTRDSRHRSF